MVHPDYVSNVIALTLLMPRAHAALASDKDHEESMVTDLKNLFSEEAAQCRRLAEIATDAVIKEKLLEMAARFQAKADEDKDDEQSTA